MYRQTKYTCSTTRTIHLCQKNELLFSPPRKKSLPGDSRFLSSARNVFFSEPCQLANCLADQLIPIERQARGARRYMIRWSYDLCPQKGPEIKELF